MFVGETRSVQLLNPKAGGYWNPSFSWWQPTADVMAKFRGQVMRARWDVASWRCWYESQSVIMPIA